MAGSVHWISTTNFAAASLAATGRACADFGDVTGIDARGTAADGAETVSDTPPVTVNDLPDPRLPTPEDVSGTTWLTANV